MMLNDDTMGSAGAKIKVVGVGGGGGNVVNTMIRTDMEGVEFLTVNTDIQALRFSLAPQKIQIGRQLTKGLGAGSDPDVGREAALEDHEEIARALAHSDMVFITAGMGGGTGTGAASIVAQIARELGALTVAVVTKPFDFEGKRRRKHAELGLARLKESVDALITIPNQRLLAVSSPSLSMLDAFKIADGVLVNAVRGITDIINVPGTLNVDFADVRTVMSSTGMALMGIGNAEGQQRASEAAKRAITSPLLEDIDIEGATGILINITAGPNLPLAEVSEACAIIHDAAHEDANIKFGVVIDETMGETIRVTVIATGFPYEGELTASATESRATRSPIIQRPTLVVPPPAQLIVPQATFAPPPPPPPAPMPVETVVAAPVVEPAREVAPIEVAPVIEAAPAAAPAPVEIPEAVVAPVAPVAPVVESEELARWTMEGMPTTTDSRPLQGAVAAVEQPIQQAIPTVEALNLEPDFDTSFGAVADTTDDLLDTFNFDDEPVLQEFRPSAEVPQVGATAVSEERPPLEAFFREPVEAPRQAAADLDRRIEEAIRIAGNLKSSMMDEESDLDIPAFLRNGMKDLPNR